MSIALSAHGLRAAFGARALFEGVGFTIADGERIGLIGPNGAGKSTLLRILSGATSPDEGDLARRRGLRVGHVEQVPLFADDATVESSVLEGVGATTTDPDERSSRAREIMAKLGLAGRGRGAGVSPETPVETLSGGWRKRVAIARALGRDPDLLLLDEPTNHLDVESIEWLEEMLAAAPFATVTITHDRLFLQRVATRILELDRRNPGGLLSVAGDYAAYVRVKADNMHAQERRETVLRNSLRRETEWLSHRAPARSTKQQARIQRAGQLRAEVGELGVRNLQRKTSLDFEGAAHGPRRLIEARGVGMSYDGRTLFSGVDLRLGPGTRIGLLGANGCGKSTLIRILLGEEPPTEGTVERADKLTVAYFAQARDALDPDETVADTVCPDGDFVSFRGARVHVRGYLERFLFTSEQMEMPTGKLSGGEQSRLLLAQLMLRPAQLLVLDEPTNDLDLATLAVLEESLTEFTGAVLLVSHDRYFLDQVATTLLAFDTAAGRIVPFASLAQWEAWRAEQAAAPAANASPGGGDGSSSRRGARRRLGYLEQREYESIEETIGRAEAAVQAAVAESETPESASNAARLMELLRAIDERRAEVDRLYTRWGELQAKLDA